MAKSLNLKVIAEGVENKEQICFLREHNCDEIQGYYFSKPLLADECAEKMRTSPHWLLPMYGDAGSGPIVADHARAQ